MTRAGSGPDKPALLLMWSGVFLLVNCTVKCCSLFTVMFLAATLQQAEFAGFGLIYSLQTLVSTFSAVGIAESTIGKLRKYCSPRRRNVCYMRANGLFGIISAITATVAVGIVITGRFQQFTVPGLFAIFLGVVYAYCALQADFHRIEGENYKSIISGSLIPLIGLLGLVSGGYYYRHLDYAFCISSFGVFVVLVTAGACGFLPKGLLIRPKKLIGDALNVAPYIATGLLGWLAGYGMNSVIARLLALEDVAEYTFLLTVTSAIQMIATSMNMVWGPRFYNLYNQGKFHIALAGGLRFYRLMLVVLTVVSLCILLIFPKVTSANQALHAYHGLRSELGYLLIGYLFQVPWWCVQSYFYINSSGRLLLTLTLMAGTGGVLCWVAAIAYLGSVGIYVGFIMNILVKSCVYSYFAWLRWSVRVPWISVLIGVLCILVHTELGYGLMTGGLVLIRTN